MRISAAFPSDYVKWSDLGDKEPILTIRSVVIEEVGQTRDKLPVLYFERTEKGLVLNKTNSNAIAAAYGDETNDWLGAQVQLFVVNTEYQGKPTQGIRVRIPRQQPGRYAPMQGAAIGGGPNVSSGYATAPTFDAPLANHRQQTASHPAHHDAPFPDAAPGPGIKRAQSQAGPLDPNDDIPF